MARSGVRGFLAEHRVAIVKLVAAYAAVRLYLLVLDVAAARRSFNGNLDGPLLGWDAWHYLQLAKSGYPAVAPRVGGQLAFSNGAFGPVFPFLIRLVHEASITLVGAAVVVSVIGGLVATLCLWRLAAAITDEGVGLSAAMIFVALPGMAVAWGVLYSECVGLALAVVSLLFMVRRRWMAAGVAGALAASPVLSRSSWCCRRSRVASSISAGVSDQRPGSP